MTPTTVNREERQRLYLLLQEKQRRLQMTAAKSPLENDLAFFFRESWKVLEPGRKLIWSWHYDLCAEYLWLIREGKFHTCFPDAVGLIINVPPRTAKSSLFTICFPAWSWIRYPERRFLCASYAAELSTEHSVKRRDLIRSEWFQSYWKRNFRLKMDQNIKSHYDNDRTGSMTSTSVTGTAIGKGGDTLIVDDPINADQAVSDTERKTANNWIDNTLRSRLNDPSSGLIIMVMQRLHEYDPTGFVMEQEPGRWVKICLPLEAEEMEEWRFPVSGKVVIRHPGDILQPDRYPPATIKSLKGRRLVWASQYQQRPSPLEGNMIRRDDVRYYGGIDPDTALRDEPLPDRFDLVCVSADCAFKDTDGSDFVAIMTVGIKGRKRYVLNVVNKHLDLDATEAEIRRQKTQYKATWILVEDKANGPAVIKRLKRNVSGVFACNPEGGKTGRMFVAAIEWQANDWYVDRNSAGAEELIRQLLLFPNAKHDDLVDAMSQLSVWLQNRPRFFGIASVTKTGGGGVPGSGDGWSGIKISPRLPL